MDRKQLEELIGRMAVVEKYQNSSESVSWNAHREAEKLTDIFILPILKEIIQEKAKPKERHIRDNAYFIYGKILKHSFDWDGCAFFIQRLAVETDKYVLSHMLDRLADIVIPVDMDIFPVIYHTQSEKWLIRHSAIKALGSCATQESREALAYYIGQSDEKKYKYEITYANAAMGKIGTVEYIPLLENHIHSRRPDIKGSAQIAIERIRARSLQNGYQ